MALGTQVVDLIGLHLLDDPNQVGAVRQVPVVQHQPRVGLMGVLIKVIDTACVEAAGAALNPVHHITFLQQQLRQIAAVLAGDPSDQRNSPAAINGFWTETHGSSPLKDGSPARMPMSRKPT